jgi:uncharacterized integral membrane protein
VATTDGLMERGRNGPLPFDGAEPAPTDSFREGRRSRRRRHNARTRLYTWAVLLVGGLIVLIALVVANAGSVRLDWVVGSTRASLALFLILAAVVGWVVGIATSAVFRHRTRARH